MDIQREGLFFLGEVGFVFRRNLVGELGYDPPRSLLHGGRSQKIVGVFCILLGVIVFISLFLFPFVLGLREWLLFPFLLIFLGLFVMVPMDGEGFRSAILPFVKARISITPERETRYIQAYRWMFWLVMVMLVVWVVLFQGVYLTLVGLGASPTLGYVMVPLAGFTMGLTSVVVAMKLVMWRYPDLQDLYRVEEELSRNFKAKTGENRQ